MDSNRYVNQNHNKMLEVKKLVSNTENTLLPSEPEGTLLIQLLLKINRRFRE